MIRFFFAVLLGLSLSATTWAGSAPISRNATSDELFLLTSAVKKYTADLGRWAYTETSILRDEKGKTKTQTELRFDPSQPPEKQWTPILINGVKPTNSDLAKYRKKGTQSDKESDVPGTRRKYSLGELLQFEAARIVEEDAKQLVFEIPLRKENNNRFPPEKFLVHVRVNKDAGTLARVAVRLRDSFRQKLVVKVKAGAGTLDFATVDEKFSPVLTSIQGDASVSVLFVNVGGTYELQRKDYKRVKPYDERFEVQIGELKALDF